MTKAQELKAKELIATIENEGLRKEVLADFEESPKGAILHDDYIAAVMIRIAEKLEKSDYKDRVIAEKAELDEKIEKLSDFIVSEKFEEIVKDFNERTDMRNQLLAMRDYSIALKSRIERF